MKRMGHDSKDVEFAVKNEKYNDIAATYLLLGRREKTPVRFFCIVVDVLVILRLVGGIDLKLISHSSFFLLFVFQQANSPISSSQQSVETSTPVYYTSYYVPNSNPFFLYAHFLSVCSILKQHLVRALITYIHALHAYH